MYPRFEGDARDTLNKNGGAFLVATGGVSRKYTGFRDRIPGCSALPVRSGGALAGFDRPAGSLRPGLGPLRPRQPAS